MDGDKDSLDMGYVVNLFNHAQLADDQAVFRFEHPNRAVSIDNTRETTCTFTFDVDASVHGLAGAMSCGCVCVGRDTAE